MNTWPRSATQQMLRKCSQNHHHSINQPKSESNLNNGETVGDLEQ